MRELELGLEMRPATMDDAEIVAGLETAFRLLVRNPGIREDRFWIVRDGDAMVGLSVIGYPPTRGLPWTFFTGTTRSVRGHGVARALKYATVAQAIALGAKRVRTNNDGENAPILHLNTEMGYRLVDPLIELHRELSS